MTARVRKRSTSSCRQFSAWSYIVEHQLSLPYHLLVQRHILRIVDLAPLPIGAEGADWKLLLAISRRSNPVISRRSRVAGSSALSSFSTALHAGGVNFRSPYIAPRYLRSVSSCRRSPAIRPRHRSGKFRRRPKDRQNAGSTAAPGAVVTDDQLAWSVSQPAHQLAAIEDVAVADDDRSRAQPRSGRGQRHHHIGFGPPFVGEIGEARENRSSPRDNRARFRSRHSATPQRRDLALDQRFAFELDEAFRPVVAKMPQAAAATGGENNGAHHSTAKTWRNSAMSAGENGAHRSGCHMIPVMGWAEWRIAFTTPSSATAQTSSGGRESTAPKCDSCSPLSARHRSG